MGDNQTVKLSSEDTRGAFTLIEQNNPPGTEIPKHYHENESEIFKVEEGEVSFTVADKTMILRDGDLVYLPPLVPHSFKVTGTQDARVTLNIFPGGLENMFEELSKLPPGPPDFEKITQICGKFGVKFV